MTSRRYIVGALVGLSAACAPIPTFKRDPKVPIKTVYLNIRPISTSIAPDRKLNTWDWGNMFGRWNQYWNQQQTPEDFAKLTKSTMLEIGYDIRESTNNVPAALILSGNVVDADCSAVPLAPTHTTRSLTVEWTLSDLQSGRNHGRWRVSASQTSQHFLGDISIAGPFMQAVNTLVSSGSFRTLVAAHNTPEPWQTLVVRKGSKGSNSSVAGAVEGLVGVEIDGRTGSGTIISSECHVLTAYHTISRSTGPFTVNYGGRMFEGTRIRVNPAYDSALIQFSGVGCKPLAVSRAKQLVGSAVFAIGNPLGVDGLVTRGIIGGRKEIEGLPVVLHDAAINPGSSGGALISADYALVGINVMKVSAVGIEGMSMAVPVDTIEKALALEIK